MWAAWAFGCHEKQVNFERRVELWAAGAEVWAVGAEVWAAGAEVWAAGIQWLVLGVMSANPLCR